MSRILIIDGNNLAHRAQHKFSLTTDRGVPSSVVYGFVYVLSSLVKRFPCDILYTVFDGGRSEHRMAILSDYKNRDSKMDETEYQSFNEQIRFLLEDFLPLTGARVVHQRHQEADDFIYSICKKHRKDTKTIVSSDKDFVQLIDERTKVFNPFKDAILSLLHVEEEYGFSPEETVDYLTLIGDKSDHIPGVPGMGPKRAREFLDEHGSIEEYLEEKEDGAVTKWDRYPIKLIQNIAQPLISLRLFHMKYMKGTPIPITTKPKDLDQASQLLLRKYQVRVLTKENLRKPFESL